MYTKVQVSLEMKNDNLIDLLQRFLSLEPRTRDGNTLLHLAVWHKTPVRKDAYLRGVCKLPCVKAMKLILYAGCDVNSVNTQESTPLHLAVTFVPGPEQVDILKEMLELLLDLGADTKLVNKNGQTVMDCCETDEARGILSAKGGLGAMNIEARKARKNEVTGSGVGEGRGERFVLGTEKDLNENVKRETKRRSGLFRELTQQLEHVQPRNRDGELREMTQQLKNVRRQLQERDGQLSEKDRQLRERDEELREKTQQLTKTQGQLQEKDKQLREKTQQLIDVRSQLQERDGQLMERTQQLTNTQGQLREKDGELREKTQQLTNVRRDGQLREMRIQLTDLQRQVQERDGQLRRMTQQLTNTQGQLQERDGELKEKTQQLKNAGEQLQGKDEEVSSLESRLEEKEQQVDELEESFSATRQALNRLSRQQSPDWVIPRDEIQLTEECLGTGGWGIVVKGRYCGCTVAVKQIYDSLLKSSSYYRESFEREMNIASRCRHPCLLQFIGATNDERSPLFVTELMETSLRALLELRSLSPTEVSVISLDVARALNYLHLKKPSPIIHRDISSANVLLWREADQWRGKVSDYGTANFKRDIMTACPGSRIYSAPEALTESQTAKLDVYSFGVLLCEICTRKLPDPDRRDEQVAMVKNRILRALIRRCLKRAPEARPSMEDIIGELEQSLFFQYRSATKCLSNETLI
ncbi:probable serine/threonine-protein kinase drkD isoform X2 [Pocillopora damicornis]|uniref:probable serine/threonine-protein kinase drkD isoform X2 n=1 Tax=Pocillopora damicornis TaxID=46731 RepID=UPI000F55562A|nr:probable serine/threonine-protein kinase drkD isoform X2 [Pocillopora damicornis]